MVAIALNYATPPRHPEILLTPLFIGYVVCLMLVYLVPTYFNLYYLMPRFLLTKRYLAYFTILSIVILFLLIIQFISEDIAYSAMGIDPVPSYNFSNTKIFILDLFGNYILNFIAFTGCSVTLLLRYWMEDSERAGKLESEHLKTEVEHLKQQIDPAFLFQTLNRIAKTGEQDTTEASVFLMKFSKLLRYQLYDSNRNEVFLTSEVQFINDYLHLEQLHYKLLKYHISIEGDISYTLVPPMLFIPFIRHMINGINNREAYSNLTITFNDNEKEGNLVFSCTGDMKPDTESEPFNGIKQRLNLLYGDGYKLQIMPPPFIIPDGQKITLTLNLY